MKKLFVTIILLLSFGSTWAIDITLEKTLKEENKMTEFTRQQLNDLRVEMQTVLLAHDFGD